MADAKTELENACQRMARTGDGRTFYQHLIAVLMDVEHPAANPGALHQENGRRNFAREIEQLWREPTANGNQVAGRHSDSGGRTDSTETGRRSRGARRRRLGSDGDQA